MIIGLFDGIEYDGIKMANIFKNYSRYVKQAAKDLILRDYLIEGSDRPELVSWKLYDEPQYYFVLLILNDIYDPYHDWVKTQDAVHLYTQYKYKDVKDINSVAYHMDYQGNKYYNLYQDPDNPRLWYDLSDNQKRYLQYNGTLVPITIIEDELSKNEDRRTIKIINPNDMNAFLTNFKRIIGKAK